MLPAAQERGVAVVAVIVLLLLVDLAIVGAVLGTGRDQVMTSMQLESVQAYYAAEAGINMAIRELFEGSDEDADGTIGSVSDNGNDADDPLIGVASVYVQGTTAGGVTALISRSSVRGTRRHLAATIDGQPGDSSGRDLLFVVPNASSLGSQDQAKTLQMEAWGYTITPISASDSQAAFDTAVAANDVVYISEEISSAQLNTKLRNASIGIVSEETFLNDDLGISSNRINYDGRRIDIVDNSHYITFLFRVGRRRIANGRTSLNGAGGVLAGGSQVIAQRVSSSTPSLVVIETGGALQGGGWARGRRVMLPFGGNSFDFNRLHNNGLTIMRRAIEWAAQTSGMVGHWKLDEGRGTTAIDSVGSNNGRIRGGRWTAGQLGGALAFDGRRGSVAIPNAPNLQLTRTLTIAGWVNGRAWGSGFDVDLIARKGGNNPNNYQLAIDNGRVNLYLDGYDNSTGFSGDTLLNPGQWYHVAGTWDGTTVSIYVNGALDHSPRYARGGAIGTDSRNLYIGGRGSMDVLDGRVDDVRLYDRALSDSEIASLARGALRVASWQEAEP